jgi:hypothetical protein
MRNKEKRRKRSRSSNRRGREGGKERVRKGRCGTTCRGIA